MRGARAGLRRPSVLLLLALRARRRSVRAPRGLRRPGRLRKGEAESPATPPGVPSEGGAGVRPAEDEDRGPRGRRTYLRLEVRTTGRPRVLASPHSMYRRASAGGTREARIAGWAVLAIAAADVSPTMSKRWAHGTTNTTM